MPKYCLDCWRLGHSVEECQKNDIHGFADQPTKHAIDDAKGARGEKMKNAKSKSTDFVIVGKVNPEVDKGKAIESAPRELKEDEPGMLEMVEVPKPSGTHANDASNGGPKDFQ